MHLLVFRFSAMGDVALLAPVIKSVLEQHPTLSITLVTRQKFEVFFAEIPRLEVMGVDLKKDYKGVFGLYRLYRILKKKKIDKVVDQHQNLRTTILKIFFSCSFKPIYTLDKDRKSKKERTRKDNKVRGVLPHTTQRYLDTFAKAGFEATLGQSPFINTTIEGKAKAKKFLEGLALEKKDGDLWIGLAPFAQHDNKIWGIKKIEALIALLPDHVTTFLYGGGSKEVEIMTRINTMYPKKTVLVAGHLWLPAELALMQSFDKMLCMDSSNMHFAALLGVDTLSIWGGTHPDLGFYALQQPSSNIIQIDTNTLPCRPCSVFGNKPCLREDKACMDMIEPSMVLEKLLQ